LPLPCVALAAACLFPSRGPANAELLARLGDLKDRGLITEEEFQKEKRRCPVEHHDPLLSVDRSGRRGAG
jgi:hypothetical protein